MFYFPLTCLLLRSLCQPFSTYIWNIAFLSEFFDVIVWHWIFVVLQSDRVEISFRYSGLMLPLGNILSFNGSKQNACHCCFGSCTTPLSLLSVTSTRHVLIFPFHPPHLNFFSCCMLSKQSMVRYTKFVLSCVQTIHLFYYWYDYF